MPSDRIMWGADTVQAEGIYAATEFTRQCLAEALAEKVERGELREEHAAAHRPANPARQRAEAVSETAADAVARGGGCRQGDTETGRLRRREHSGQGWR